MSLKKSNDKATKFYLKKKIKEPTGIKIEFMGSDYCCDICSKRKNIYKIIGEYHSFICSNCIKGLAKLKLK